MSVLVTGGAGFIGSHIVDRLLKDGYEVVVLDNFSTGNRTNLPDSEHLKIVNGDIADYNTVCKAMKNVRYVFHQAAIASVVRTIKNPIGSMYTNYLGTLNLLKSARDNDVRKFVFASSAAVYGNDGYLPKYEPMKPCPITPYAVDKLSSEHMCSVFSNLYGLDTISLRYFNVFGPRQDPSSSYSGVISVFADGIRNGVSPTIYGDGKQTRDFIYVSDIVEANMKAMFFSKGISDKVFNIASGIPISIGTVLYIMYGIEGVKINKPEYRESRDGDIKYSYADIKEAFKILNWSPEISFETGVRILLNS